MIVTVLLAIAIGMTIGLVILTLAAVLFAVGFGIMNGSDPETVRDRQTRLNRHPHMSA